MIAALFAVALLAPPTSSAGQGGGQATGSIVGVAQDATGGALPNVQVTISSDAIMGPRVMSSAADGTFRITALPPGDYRLSFSASGFTTVEHDVRVAVGFTATLDVTLPLATQREQVMVTARSSVLDRQSTAIAASFDSRRLADLPGSRNLSALLAMAQAVQMPNTEVAGGTGALAGEYGAYGTGGGNRPTLEGIVVQGIFNSGGMLDYGSFEEASVLTAAHGPEVPTYGVHLQFVTKTGGNRYRGTLYADYENRAWQSHNVDDGQIANGALGGDGRSARDANRLWHDHDVNGDVGGFISKDKLWWYASIRDQNISSRLVKFPVRPHRTRLTNYGGKGTYRIAPGHTLVGFAQKGRNHQPNRLDSFGSTGDNQLSVTAINESEDSTADQRNVAWVWKGEWNAVIDDTLLLDVRLGQFGTGQTWRRRSADLRFEDLTTQVVRGGNRDWNARLRRHQMFGTLTSFKDGWMGSHHLKAGGEMMRFVVGESWLSGYPNNVLHTLRGGTPDEVYFFDTPSKSESGLWTYAAYAADSWRVNNRLTLNLGIRFDRYRVFLPAQEHPFGSPTARQFAPIDNLIDWNVVVPRLGAVYDLTGEGTTLAKVTFSRYRGAPGASVGSNSNPNATVWWTRYDWTDLNGNGTWERGEEGDNVLGQRGNVAIESLDPALQLPVLNEVGTWIERELPARIGVRTGVIWRGDHQYFARQNANQPFGAFTVPVPIFDPGPDGQHGSPDDGLPVLGFGRGPEFAGLRPVNIVRNIAGSRSDYWTWEVAATSRGRGRWSLGAGFAQTWNRDQSASYSGQAVRNNNYPLTPNDLINAGPGGRHHFTTWNAKAYATYETLWRVRVAPVLRHQSGQPFGRTFTTDALGYGTIRVLAEPIGTRRMDNLTILDVRIEKRFRLNENRRIATFIDLFNCFNANPVEEMIWSSGPSFLRPVRIVAPRVAGIGVKFDW